MENDGKTNGKGVDVQDIIGWGKDSKTRAWRKGGEQCTLSECKMGTISAREVYGSPSFAGVAGQRTGTKRYKSTRFHKSEKCCGC